MASVDWEAVAGGVFKINIKIVTKIYGKTPAMDSFLRKKKTPWQAISCEFFGIFQIVML